MNARLTIDPEIIYPTVEKLLCKMAWNESERTNGLLSFEDAIGICHEGFMLACHTYDPDQGTAFSTWCQYKVGLFIKRKLLYPHHTRTLPHSTLVFGFDTMDETTEVPSQSPTEGIWDIASQLSEDAKEMLSLLIDTPEHILQDQPLSPKQLLRKVKDYLVAQGKKPFHVVSAQQEIKTTFQAAWAN